MPDRFVVPAVQPRRGPGLNWLDQFMNQPKPKPIPKEEAELYKYLFNRAGSTSEDVGKAIGDYVGSTFGGELDKPGQEKIRSEIIEHFSSFIIPKKMAKAVTEIGGGPPILSNPRAKYLGQIEEARIAAETEEERRAQAAAAAARRRIIRDVVAGFFATLAPVAAGDPNAKSNGLTFGPGGNTTADELFAMNPPDP